MREYDVIFRSAEEIAAFVNAVNRYPYPVELCSATATFNARSLLNLFCVQLQTPLTLRAPANADDGFCAAIRPYLCTPQLA